MAEKKEIFLNENQVDISFGCIANIEDKLEAIKHELYSREKPHKPYLNEKLDSIYWDVKVLKNICKVDDENEEV